MDQRDDDYDDETGELSEPVEITTADLTEHAEELARARRALEPVQASLQRAGFYAYGTFDDQQRWTIAVDDEMGRVDVRVGDDGLVVEIWGTSPGLFSEDENEWSRRVHERLARMTIPNVSRGMLAPHQTAMWDDVEQGVAVRLHYELPFTRAEQIGAFVREHFPEVDDVISFVESQMSL